MRFPFLALVALLLARPLTAQSPVFFRDVAESSIVQNAPRWIVPASYRTVGFEFENLKNWLAAAPPMEKIVAHETEGLPLALPLADGRTVDFLVWEMPVMAPELCRAFPDIRSFSGKSTAGDGTTVRFDHTPMGFHAMILSPVFGSIFIDPYARGNVGDYIVYERSEFYKTCQKTMECAFDDRAPLDEPVSNNWRAGDCGKLHTYRLALACTGEYATFCGGTKALALAAMNTSMTRVNGVYEKQLAVHMTMVANDTAIIYLNGATDPYTNSSGSTMLGENQTNCDAVIGTANYDVGHVFSTGGGGVANLNGPCSSTLKARGVTGSSSPVGDPFDIDYVAHEMGHQFGANHTFYSNVGSCNGNMSNSRAFEPGSGTTIMAYAGICGSTDIQPHSDAYFHTASLLEIGIQVAAHTCEVETANGNSPPTIATISSATIPTATPFVLTGAATDPNGDAVAYLWEQYNPHTSGSLATMPPVGSNTKGPLFRSWEGTSAAARYFPKLATVVAGTTSTWEVLPTVARTLFFRLSVFDNNPLGGCTTQFPAASLGITASATTAISLTTSTTGAPFTVNYPTLAGVNWPLNFNPTVTWTPIGTASTVDILLSTDGGVNFSTTLATATANDGSQMVTLPVGTPQGSTNRIMVRAVGNYYYDVSNSNFTISAALPLELTGFSARPVSKNQVRLDWETASESGLRGFLVERATGESVDFQPLGFVKSAGESRSERAYSFLDEDARPGQSYYYRLFFEEEAGCSTTCYSPVRAVSTGAVGGAMAIEPNPVFENAVISVAEDGPLDVEIFSAAGVFLKKIRLDGGREIDLADLPSGSFVAVARSERAVWTGRFVKF